MNRLWYDRDGRPIDKATWDRLRDDVHYTRLANTTVRAPSGRQAQVSTVWVGLCGDPFGPPLIFETAVVVQTPENSRRHVEAVKYTTEHAACQGHVVMVGRVRAGEVDLGGAEV